MPDQGSAGAVPPSAHFVSNVSTCITSALAAHWLLYLMHPLRKQETDIMKRTFILTALLAVGSAGFTPLPAMAQPYVSVVVGGPPPPPRFERVPSARRGHIWS